MRSVHYRIIKPYKDTPHGHCNRLFMNYYVTGNNVDLNLGGFELKCEKCKRVLRLKHYTEQMLIEHSENGVFRV